MAGEGGACTSGWNRRLLKMQQACGLTQIQTRLLGCLVTASVRARSHGFLGRAWWRHWAQGLGKWCHHVMLVRGPCWATRPSTIL
jgi:hypothetical protein